MTKKQATDVFTLQHALLRAVREAIPPAQLARLEPEQKHGLMLAATDCAHQVDRVLNTEFQQAGGSDDR